MTKLLALCLAVAIAAPFGWAASIGPVHAASARAEITDTVIDVQGDVQAERYARGTNRFRDRIRHYLHLARRGDAYALRELGFYYQKGWGVFRDNTKAYMWFTLAGERGNQDALGNRASIAKTMRPGQIQRAEQMAETWKRNYKWVLEIGPSD